MLHVLGFTSDRKRMSVILRAEDGTIKIICKGADTTMLPRLRSDYPEEKQVRRLHVGERMAEESDGAFQFLCPWLVLRVSAKTLKSRPQRCYLTTPTTKQDVIIV